MPSATRSCNQIERGPNPSARRLIGLAFKHDATLDQPAARKPISPQTYLGWVKSDKDPISPGLSSKTCAIFYTVMPGNDVGIVWINGLSDRCAKFKEHAEHNVCQAEAITTDVGFIAH